MVNEALDPKTCVRAEDCSESSNAAYNIPGLICHRAADPTTSVQLMACSVGVQNHIRAVQVLTESFPYIQAEPIDITTNYASTWSDWTGPGAPTDSILTNVGLFILRRTCTHRWDRRLAPLPRSRRPATPCSCAKYRGPIGWPTIPSVCPCSSSGSEPCILRDSISSNS